MSKEQWLLGFHVLGAVLFVAGAVTAGILQTAAMLRERPSEIAPLLRLTRIGVLVVGVGTILAVAFGAWLVEDYGLGWGTSWISTALALLILSMVLGAAGGRQARHTRYLAERLAGEGDRPSDELRSALTSPVALIVNYASFLAALAIVALMIWKP